MGFCPVATFLRLCAIAPVLDGTGVWLPRPSLSTTNDPPSTINHDATTTTPQPTTITNHSVQPILRSSYCQFGTGTLDRDVDDLCMLMTHLHTHQGFDNVALLGHSTGCQIIAHFVKTCKDRSLVAAVSGCILQGAVSDRESWALEVSEEERKRILQEAQSCAAPDTTIVTMLYGVAPLTATRVLDLYAPHGRDDMFSSDLSLAQLRERLSTLPPNTTFVLSGADQYVPTGVYRDGLPGRLQEAVEGSTVVVVDGGDHSLTGHGQQLVELVDAVLRRSAS